MIKHIIRHTNAFRLFVALLATSSFSLTALAQETAEETPVLDSGNTAWMITSTILVLLMTIPGIALFYGGLVRQKNMISVMMQTMFIVGVISILWVAFGYSWAFGTATEGTAMFTYGIGGFDKAFLAGITKDTLTAGNIPEFTFVMFQCMFALITPALILGAFAERIRFKGYMLFIILWVVLSYFPMAHWVWGGGWAMQDGALDFAGGTVVLRHGDFQKAQTMAGGEAGENHVGREGVVRDLRVEGREDLGAHQAIGRVHVPNPLAVEEANAKTRDEGDDLTREGLAATIAATDQEVIIVALGPQFGEGFGPHLVVGVNLKDPVGILCGLTITAQNGRTMAGVGFVHGQYAPAARIGDLGQNLARGILGAIVVGADAIADAERVEHRHPLLQHGANRLGLVVNRHDDGEIIGFHRWLAFGRSRIC